jgi:hypothetical protein
MPGDGTPVKLDKVAHNGQPEAQASLTAIEGARSLGEQIEQFWNKVWSYAVARVADAHYDLTVGVLHDQRDLPPGWRILGGVGE